ncbi:exonuclease 1 isoform X5 [Elephas maximus indicus]|uniref:exonuclease 1 isoform X5 n=1 Tax=Elephas maximus indicus TaxID=99487 RepID=UPI002116DC16|nr:exonuclease 1 isoform X5 [Elephas maximus indicus]
MGIQGLLQFIKEASEPIHVRKYKGQVVAVDTYCWLHKGAIACAEKLARGEPTDKYVGFCMKFVNMLLSHGIKPILVFDGCTLPSKKEVEESRRERRQANLLKGKQLLREGKVSEARECFTRSINITHAMAHKVIKAARSQGVDCLVAPYEADAQLAYLNRAGIVQAIITEDSDLLAFGCKKVIKKIGHYLKMNITVPEDYIKGFIRANNTFLYQLVFDPIKRKLIPLNAYEDDIDPETLSYAGWYVDDSIALQIALGNKDINTLEQIDDYNPDTATPAQSRSHNWNDRTCQKSSNVNSIWRRNHCSRLELDIVSKATPLKEDPTVVGIEQVISTKKLNLRKKISVVKRPRSEELSEDDLLSQYSLSCTKKTKKDNCEGNKSLNSSEMFTPDLVDGTARKKSTSTPPRTRNKFATFLQRKNKENDAVVVPGTRSRFFCSSLDPADCVSKKESSQPLDESAVTDEETHLKESDCLEGKRLADTDVARNSSDQRLADTDVACNSSDQIPDDVSMFAAEESQSLKTNQFTRTISPPTLGTLRSCFSWSGSLGDFSRSPSPSPRTALQRFRRESDSPTSLSEKSEMAAISPSNSGESGDESHPSREVGRPSHSQECIELSPHDLNASKLSQPSSKDSDSEGSDCNFKSLDNQDYQNSKLHLSHFSKKDRLRRNKVPGLYKSSSAESLSTTKIKPLVPAKVSGLSKKAASLQRRNHRNAENKPGLQIKISELWRNFGFKKNSEKLPSCKKPAPLSPVEDNIQLTPDAEDDIFNKPECTRVQRAIFQ